MSEHPLCRPHVPGSFGMGVGQGGSQGMLHKVDLGRLARAQASDQERVLGHPALGLLWQDGRSVMGVQGCSVLGPP